MEISTGAAPPKKREGRPVLSLNRKPEHPSGNRSLLAGVEHFFTEAQLNEAERWGQALWQARNVWSIERAKKNGGRNV